MTSPTSKTASTTSTHSIPKASRQKRLPPLDSKRQRLGDRLLDLAWLANMTAKAAPMETALFVIVTFVAGMTTPLELWATRHLIDNLALRAAGDVGGVTDVWIWLAVLVGGLIVQRIMSVMAPLYRVKAREVAGRKLEASALRKASRLELIAFEDQDFYNQLDRVMEGSHRRGPDVIRSLVEIVGRAPAIIGYIVVLVYYAPTLLPISLAAIVATIVTIWRMGEYSWRLLHEQTKNRRLADYFASSLSNRAHAKELRIYNLAPHFLDRWSGLYWQTRNDQRRLAVRQTVRERLLIVVAGTFSVVGLWWVISRGFVSASPGEYAIIFTALLGMWSLADMSMTIKELGETAGYAGDFRAFLTLPEEGEKRSALSLAERSSESSVSEHTNGEIKLTVPYRAFPMPLQEGIRFDDVWFTYPGTERPVLKGLSFDIRTGEKVALVGENGAGKSTIVKLLLGFYQPDHGRITFDGIDIREIDPRELRRAFSAIFQQSVQYQLKLIDNVILGDPSRPANLARVEEAARRSGLAAILDQLDLGLESTVGPDVGGTELSGGQWQRVALARAFYRQADILVLDEPTAALDPKAEFAVFQRFVELAEERTALLISHRMGMARLADRIVVLRDGQVVETGTHDRLMAQQGEYAVLFEMQARWYR